VIPTSSGPMRVKYLIVGAGMTGLAFANFIRSDDYLILDGSDEIGGWCKTIKQDGYVWDFSGHFFHFRRPDIEKYLVDRMPAGEVDTVVKSSKIYFSGTHIDFPFQKNIHQLPRQDFIECLHDLVFREDGANKTFKEMLVSKFGHAIANKFLIPYNTKLYACDLDTLDADAMGRFFPHADLKDIVANMKAEDNQSYNATFTYPKGGAIMYVDALASEVDPQKIALNERVEQVDLIEKTAVTSAGRTIEFEYLISSAPFDDFVQMTSPKLPVNSECLTKNQVLVFNLGFDRKGPEGVHWIYYPDDDLRFYRVGFYDNIVNSDRMSLYVEIGMPSGSKPDVKGELERVLVDLGRAGVVEDHQLVSWHTVTMNPAYVHINRDSREAVIKARQLLQSRGVYTIGRYGGWTYCSIEDNIIEAQNLANELNLFEP